MATLRDVKLEDKYTQESGRIYLTGIQALVRLPMMQRRRDLAAGHNTAGYVSGYRGSPLGGYDQQLAAAQKFLQQHHVVFQPGLNEDLAATACSGTQQVAFTGQAKYDGVFSIWYGKGPGVDRSGDAFRHGNLFGTSPLGGVLVLMGDDHTCESSTTAHQSEYALVDAMIPVLNPAGVQEILDYGLYGFALSRYSGTWVGIKCVHDTVNTAAAVELDARRVQINIPADFTPPPDGLHIRENDPPRTQEYRLHNFKLDAVKAFARANHLDRIDIDSPNAKIGIITTGKSYLDTRSALDELNLCDADCERFGIRLYKVGMTWPMEPQGLEQFAQGLDLIIVVEEKRGLMEGQIKEMLYGRPNAPRIIGKQDERGQPMFRSSWALDPNQIAQVIGHRILSHMADDKLVHRVAAIDHLLSHHEKSKIGITRMPYFCPGCPHSTGTKVPEGSKAMAGIGCHFLAQSMDRNTSGYTQMGGEGASWMGMAPFTNQKHVFQNIGDGTYFHSGLLAVRAVAASGANTTFKVLYNDAVAMTGGQRIDGQLSVPQITLQLHAEGAKRVAVVTDDPEKYPPGLEWAPGVTIHHRDDYDQVQREFREIPGLSGIVYDQTCATEKRRRRKRGKMIDPPKRTVINEAVCEGCGDCGVQSNCVAVMPLDTEFGRKRAIDQSNCNKDFSCVKGFCPSFVTVHGGQLKKGKAGSNLEIAPPALTEPVLVDLEKLGRPYRLIVTGVGGQGTVTVGSILGMAAHVEGRGCGVMEMTGLAQKGGAVLSYVRIGLKPDDIKTTKIATGGADLMIGGDLIVSGNSEGSETLAHGTKAVINTNEVITGAFTRNTEFRVPSNDLKDSISAKVGQGNVHFVNATRIATALMGDSIATNFFLVGYAYQKGWLPISAAAIERAIELNGAAIEMNKQALAWGRRAAIDLDAVQKIAMPATSRPQSENLSQNLDELIERRVTHLTKYQNAAYAARYRSLVDRVRAAESGKFSGKQSLSEAVARYYAKLLAYKDEYEVARLYTDGEFTKKIAAMFEGDYSLNFNLAPPLFSKRDPVTGHLRKSAYGPWMFRAFKLLAPFKGLRGGALDIFGYSAERRMERQLIADYEKLVDEILGGLNEHNYEKAIALAQIPEQIRGFGHIKERHLVEAKNKESELLAAFKNPSQPTKLAA
jgi:indolepyruvate ferredoxin oxidoreductase